MSNDLKVPILSCKLCSYWKRSKKKNVIGFCKKLNFYLYRNFAPLCLAFTVEEQVRVITTEIASPPAGKKITELQFTYDVDKDVEKIEAYEKSTLLFTLTFTYDGDKDVTSIKRSEA